MHGHGKETLKHFERMFEGVQPDDVTFVCVLLACNHAGLVDEGMRCYASMVTDYMISTTLEHYRCMVDLLDRVGHLQERIWSWQCPIIHTWQHVWICSVLVKFMVMWR
jgi:hypothetical protein